MYFIQKYRLPLPPIMPQKIAPFALFILFVQGIFAQDFKIQVAAYSDSVPMAHFIDRGIEGITVTRGAGGTYQYFLGYFATREVAEDIREQLVDRGFSNPVIIDIKAEAVLSEKNCGYASGFVEPTEDLTVKHPLRFIFFADGQTDLNEKAKVRLDQIAADLKANPKKNLRIMGFTDNKGDAEANMALSQKRANAVRNYFINKNVSVLQLQTEYYGEANPWYSNRDEKGVELPENQRWNNRVMMKYFDK
jgi:outer membrane protein OmpA-like peptidoglycan-associated protein